MTANVDEEDLSQLTDWTKQQHLGENVVRTIAMDGKPVDLRPALWLGSLNSCLLLYRYRRSRPWSYGYRYRLTHYDSRRTWHSWSYHERYRRPD